ncbi:hypothetical protein DPMN_050307 [Dreissena polymorpha]|uniref:Uncharacterized protein n=1 Tax=Dreissena polymorpha TaxID=45954 RepID=A0A9D4CHL1_DREPO|nr:hypothetical protein DPMN_050307 [Dreissena polymorpha]
MATVRQYDGDNAIERWRHCDDTKATVRYDYRIVAPISMNASKEIRATIMPTVPTLTAALSVNVRPDTETRMGSGDSAVLDVSISIFPNTGKQLDPTFNISRSYQFLIMLWCIANLVIAHSWLANTHTQNTFKSRAETVLGNPTRFAKR